MNIEHTDVAAYALGLLDARDREDFEAHLADCESCASELAEFAAMADLFADATRIETDDDGPDEAAVVDLLSRRAVLSRRKNIQRGWLAAVACLVLLAGGAVAGAAAAPRHTSIIDELRLSGAKHHATNLAQGGITGTVGLVSHPWGTEVILKLSRVRGPLDCELIAIAKSGEQRVLMGWLVPATGYGVPGHPADLLIEGGTSIPINELASIKIQVVHGATLLNIPV
jgi:Putative zinc-finger